MLKSTTLVLNRKPVIALAVFIIIVVGILHSTDRIPTYTSWRSKPASSCSPARSNPFDIKPPKPANRRAVSQLWTDLQELFDEHPPSPSHIDQPKHDIERMPTKELLDSFFNLTNDDAAASRANHQAVLDKLTPYPPGRFSGRGVVMLAGGRFSEYAATSLGMIREVGSQLPVEVWMKDETEDIPGWCDELQTEGMTCRYLSEYMDPGVLKHNYAMKIFTILFSSFEEVLLLDADSAPIQYPDPIFDSEIYQEKGAILWPDYWRHTGSPWLPYIIGLTDAKSEMFYDDKTVESGQLVWNKKQHWKSLLLATYYNYYGPDFYYTIFNNGWAGWGDKDTFSMALKASNEPWVQIKHDIVTLFLSGTLLGIGMLQSNPLNETGLNPMFLHSNMVKWSMREFSCMECDDQPNYSSRYHLEDARSTPHAHLKEGKRLFAPDWFNKHGIDPEPMMWRTLEHAACRSRVWGHKQVCEQTRWFMQKAFGYQLLKSDFKSVIGTGKDYCLVDPREVPATVPTHSDWKVN